MSLRSLLSKKSRWVRETFSSLHVRIAFALLVLSIPALIFVGVLSYQSRANEVDRIRAQSVSQLDHMIHQMDGEIIGTHALLEALANVPIVRNKQTKDCERLFVDLLKVDLRYSNISLIDTKGNIVCSGVPPTKSDNFSDRYWFKKAIETKNFAVGVYQVGRITGRSSLGFGHPTLDAQGRVTGVVFAALDLNALNLRLEDRSILQTSEVVIVDRNGTVLVRVPNPERWIGKPIEQNVATTRLLVEKSGSMDVQNADGRVRSYVFDRINEEWDAELHAVVSIDVAAEQGFMSHPLEDVLILGFIVVILSLLFVNRVVQQMVIAPLNDLILSAERMQGNFSIRAVLPRRQDELFLLAKKLNEAFDTVERSVNQLKERDTELLTQSKERGIVSEVNRIMARARDPQSLFDDVCRILVEKGQFTFAWVALVDEKNRRLQVGAKWGNDDGYIQSRDFNLDDPNDPAAIVLKGGVPVIFNDMATDPRMAKVRDILLKRSVRSAAWFPFKNEQGKVIGGIAFYAPKPSSFSDELVRLYDEVAQDVGFAVQSMENVSRRTLAEGRAEETESRLANVLELTPDAIAVVRDEVFLYSNRKAADILGAESPKALLGTSFLEFVTEDRRAALVDHLKGLRSEKREPALEISVRRLDGSLTTVEVIMAPYAYEGAPAAILVFRDITQRKINEKQVESLNELRNTFIHVISHQLRAPLNAIRWQLESLLSGDLGKLEKSQEQTLEAVYSAEIEMLRRIHNLLTAMDIEEGREAPKKETVEFMALWSSVAETMKRECHTKGLKCSISIPRTKHPVIHADREKIRSILETLVSNALLYTKSGGEIRAKITATETLLRFEITDTGIGIPEAEQSRVFERFFRASNATSMLPDASGLGLSIAKHFVEQHGGTIGFTSKEGKGTTFWVELPTLE